MKTEDASGLLRQLTDLRRQVQEDGAALYKTWKHDIMRDAFEASMVRGDGKDRKVDLTNMRARLVGLTVVDETGQRLFTDEEADLLGAKSGAALDRVFAISQKLNGLSGADVEELTKNSSGVLSAVSTSDSAFPSDSNTLTISSGV